MVALVILSKPEQAGTTPHFIQRDPQAAAFWDERFARDFMPWDHGDVPIELTRFIAQAAHPMHTLIPGCGLGHEVRQLALAGWEVTAIDFSPVAVAAAQAALGDFADRVQLADFFDWQPARPIDFIYERAFLCAMPCERWPEVIARCAGLLAPGALLGGYYFYDDAPKGPPFGADRAHLAALMQPCFALVEDAPATQSIAVFAGKERWQLWQRLAD